MTCPANHILMHYNSPIIHMITVKDDPQLITEMKKIYINVHILSKQTAISHHTDHIIPLQDKNVSDLHIPTNLQVLTAVDNISKSNSFTTYTIIGDPFTGKVIYDA